MNKKVVDRAITNDIYSHLKKEEITVIVGPRQAGKTTLLTLLQEKLKADEASDNRIIYFNLDIQSQKSLFASQDEFIRFLKARLSKERLYIFIDEAERIGNTGLFFKGIYDLGWPVKFILTGSSSLELKSKITESLTGRKRIFKLYPFSFSEFLKAKNYDLSLLKINKLSQYDLKYLNELLFEYLEYGGYPKVVMEKERGEKIKHLEEIYSSYIEKDIISFLKIEKPDKFLSLVKILSSQIGSLVNMDELSRTIGVERKTIERYFFYLEETNIVKRVQPLAKNKRTEIIKMPKVYFIDTGLHNFALENFSSIDSRQDKGNLLENFVFSQLYFSGIKPYFYRTKEGSEVDFVVKKQNEYIPIEVKASSFKKPYIEKSLLGFINKVLPKRGFVVNLGLKKNKQIGQTSIKYILPYTRIFTDKEIREWLKEDNI